jgi:methyl-accepting chemotaxis protein
MHEGALGTTAMSTDKQIKSDIPAASTTASGDATTAPAAPSAAAAPAIEVAAPTHDGAPIIAPPVAAPELGDMAAAAVAAGPSRINRFVLLAASMALAAGIGSAVGAAGFAGVIKLTTPAAKPAPVAPPTIVRTEPSEEIKTLRDTVSQLRTQVRSLTDSVGGMRNAIDASAKANTAQVAKVGEQFGKVNEQFARMHEQFAKVNDGIERSASLQAEPAARLGKVIETLERLERRAANMAPETTASISSRPLAAPANAAPQAQNGSPTIVDGWFVRGVVDGLAVLEGPDRIVEVEAGDNIRGVGRVQDIKKMDGRWAVVTPRGVILSR